ncbi:hypothetical protein E2C01_101030 [Portunus trituberculatus]|uniref:Uncharacterized protein n=1 Tax=Portunus trituberculatus TaxID=210409 RepID=A0A5B7KEK4_PORTR|nr:hypothetical protein [Portunus trituberculatus]
MSCQKNNENLLEEEEELEVFWKYSLKSKSSERVERKQSGGRGSKVQREGHVLHSVGGSQRSEAASSSLPSIYESFPDRHGAANSMLPCAP